MFGRGHHWPDGPMQGDIIRLMMLLFVSIKPGLRPIRRSQHCITRLEAESPVDKKRFDKRLEAAIDVIVKRNVDDRWESTRTRYEYRIR